MVERLSSLPFHSCQQLEGRFSSDLQLLLACQMGWTGEALDRKRCLGPDFMCIKKNHSTQDSRVVPHRGTNWAALWLTAQIKRDAVISESYGRG